MNIVVLKSSKCRDTKHLNYPEPLEYRKIKLANGVFLCDKVCGMMFGPVAKQVGEGVWQSTHLSTHFMYEYEVNEETGELIK